MIFLRDLIVGYHGYSVTASINGHIKQGDMVAITGINGSGKSTFLKTLIGFIPPVSGILEFGKMGKPVIGYLPQIKKIDYQLPLTVFDVVSMGFWTKINLLNRLSYDQRLKIWRSLGKVKMLSLLDRYVDKLSGGEIQRMLFARILVQEATLILLDEPFQGIDNNICELMFNAIFQLCSSGCTVIVSLHDNNLITKYFTDVLLLTRSSSIWR